MDKTISTTRLTTAQEEALTRMADTVSKIGDIPQEYNVVRKIIDISIIHGAIENPFTVSAIADAIEEIGTPSAIEVANHIREDLKNV